MRGMSFILTLLAIEFLDELIFGTREAAWPFIRSDLNLTYLQVGYLLSVPSVVGNLVEAVIGILGDTWRRRILILGGGLVFGLALVLTATSRGFWPLLVSFVLFYPASGAFVSLSQAALMDADPDRHEQNMARWTFAGSVGIVIGPLILVGVSSLGGSWRFLFFGFSGLAFGAVFLARKQLSLKRGEYPRRRRSPAGQTSDFKLGIRNAFHALQRKEVLRWLSLLEAANLTLDVLHGYLALYLVDIAGLGPVQAGLAVAVWTGFGLLGDFLLIPLLEKVSGLFYLRVTAFLVLILFPIFLLIPVPAGKPVLIGLLGFLNAGWYAIPKGQLYTAMPNQSGTVMTVGNVFNLIGGMVPFAIGAAAQIFGLQIAMWLILLGPIALVFGLPKRTSAEEPGGSQR